MVRADTFERQHGVLCMQTIFSRSLRDAFGHFSFHRASHRPPRNVFRPFIGEIGFSGFRFSREGLSSAPTSVGTRFSSVIVIIIIIAVVRTRKQTRANASRQNVFQTFFARPGQKKQENKKEHLFVPTDLAVRGNRGGLGCSPRFRTNPPSVAIHVKIRVALVMFPKHLYIHDFHEPSTGLRRAGARLG